MKNKLIVAALLLANVLSVTAMSDSDQSQQAFKLFEENGVVKGRFTPKVDASGSNTYEGVTEDGRLVQVRFDKDGALDNTFGINGVDTTKQVGIAYDLSK